MAQKSEMCVCVWGGGGGEHAELQSSYSWGGERGGGGLTLEKEEGFQFRTSHRMNGKTGGGGIISWMKLKPYDLNLDEGFTAIKAQENKTKRKRATHTLSCTHTHIYMHYCSFMVLGIGGSGRGGKKGIHIQQHVYRHVKKKGLHIQQHIYRHMEWSLVVAG